MLFESDDSWSVQVAALKAKRHSDPVSMSVVVIDNHGPYRVGVILITTYGAILHDGTPPPVVNSVMCRLL